LFQFRKVALNATFFKVGEIRVVPFLSFGPGIFYAKDISWPNGIQCRNPKISLVTLGPGSILRGRLLVQKTYGIDLFPKIGQPFCFKDSWKTRVANFLNERSDRYPWLSLGFPIGSVERVSFRIESVGPLSQQNEILIFEILTNGRISPRQAIRESSLLLVHKFIAIANLRLPVTRKIHSSTEKKEKFRKSVSSFVNLKLKYNSIGQEAIGQTRYDFFDSGFSCFQEPLGLDLGNLDLTKERYGELRELGLQTLGQLLERLAFESHIFSSLLKKQSLLALFRLGFFPSLYFMKNLPFFAKTVGRRKIAVANLELVPGSGQIQVNGFSAEKFFAGNPSRLLMVQSPFQVFANLTFDAKVKVYGGGSQSQARALKLALARALVVAQPRNKQLFREYHFLTRDSRRKERRKYGLKKARKAPQFSKR
jgi:small subunit ribosomal protein S9